MKSNLKSALAALEQADPNFILPGKRIEMIESFLAELAAYNEHTNLVSAADPCLVLKEHVLDSFSLVPHLKAAGNLVDIGSGAGFPGLMLAIALPEMAVCLVESIKKKARFLENVVERLGLTGQVTVISERAEALGHDATLRASFDAATARAVGRIDQIAELAVPMLRRNGWLLAQKSRRQLPEERRRADLALPVLGAAVRQICFTDMDIFGKEQAIILIEKISDTPARYPRNAAQMKRLPLAGL